jgi:hypothetical protein
MLCFLQHRRSAHFNIKKLVEKIPRPFRYLGIEVKVLSQSMEQPLVIGSLKNKYLHSVSRREKGNKAMFTLLLICRQA